YILHFLSVRKGVHRIRKITVGSVILRNQFPYPWQDIPEIEHIEWSQKPFNLRKFQNINTSVFLHYPFEFCQSSAQIFKISHPKCHRYSVKTVITKRKVLCVTFLHGNSAV